MLAMSESDQADDDGEIVDPEILALLEFEPVPRKFNKPDGWTPPLQRAFIAELAKHGAPTRACDAVGKVRSGIDKVYKHKEAESFRAAWHAAIDLAERRRAAQILADHAGLTDLRAPFIDQRKKPQYLAASDCPAPGQIRNEYGEWEDQSSIDRRAAEARDSITQKMLRSRRLYLQEICDDPGKRAAFEILTVLPIDWDKAKRLEPQPDEPYHKRSMRKPDMLLTAENGWMGAVVHGPDKMAELMRDINKWRVKHGKEPVDWDA